MIWGVIFAAIPASGLRNLGNAFEAVEHIDPHFMLGAFLPALIYESAFDTQFHIIKREFWQALVLAGQLYKNKK